MRKRFKELDSSKCFILIPMIVLILTFFLSSCAKPYIGRRVNTYSSRWCSYYNVSKTCNIKDDWFVFEFTISNVQEDGKYLIEGTIDTSQGKAKSWTRIERKDSNFALILANDGVVTDYISFLPMGTYLGRKLPFKKRFETQPFDAITITWNVSVSG